MFEISLKHNWYLNINLDRKNKSSPNAHFRFSNFVLRNQKLKREKCQCSQNFDLNVGLSVVWLIYPKMTWVKNWAYVISLPFLPAMRSMKPNWVSADCTKQNGPVHWPSLSGKEKQIPDENRSSLQYLLQSTDVAKIALPLAPFIEGEDNVTTGTIKMYLIKEINRRTNWILQLNCMQGCLSAGANGKLKFVSCNVKAFASSCLFVPLRVFLFPNKLTPMYTAPKFERE